MSTFEIEELSQRLAQLEKERDTNREGLQKALLWAKALQEKAQGLCVGATDYAQLKESEELARTVSEGCAMLQRYVVESTPTVPEEPVYDSREDTIEHIKRVQQLLMTIRGELQARANVHDLSKLRAPEKELFDVMTPKLKDCTYGSDEYRGFLVQLKPALDHHYAHNPHHPEHWKDGMDGMNLLDLVEMLCDNKAAGERHADGSMERSLEVNQRRFAIGDQLQSILHNTASDLGWFNHTEELAGCGFTPEEMDTAMCDLPASRTDPGGSVHCMMRLVDPDSDLPRVVLNQEAAWKQTPRQWLRWTLSAKRRNDRRAYTPCTPSDPS